MVKFITWSKQVIPNDKPTENMIMLPELNGNFTLGVIQDWSSFSLESVQIPVIPEK